MSNAVLRMLRIVCRCPYQIGQNALNIVPRYTLYRHKRAHIRY